MGKNIITSKETSYIQIQVRAILTRQSEHHKLVGTLAMLWGNEDFDMSPSSKYFGIEQVYTYGRRTYRMKVDVPMCEQHYQAASFKNAAEKLVEKHIAIGCGVLAGIAAMIVLILRWVGDNSLVLKLFMGSIMGFGAFAMVWWVISSFIAPVFATRESKEARNSVKITLHSPITQVTRLKFANEQLAEMLQKAM